MKRKLAYDRSLNDQMLATVQAGIAVGLFLGYLIGAYHSSIWLTAASISGGFIVYHSMVVGPRFLLIPTMIATAGALITSLIPSLKLVAVLLAIVSMVLYVANSAKLQAFIEAQSGRMRPPEINLPTSDDDEIH